MHDVDLTSRGKCKALRQCSVNMFSCCHHVPKVEVTTTCGTSISTGLFNGVQNFFKLPYLLSLCIRTERSEQAV